ncbi:hypothetical protein CVD28_09890 [Bacillus sp. M6-12]|uniref:RNA polymerase sigma factor n=1 Tax=Bacillus sp. M6-12 TaxID=2054166 RepID=UPI000C78BAC1|nr:RNA polymerase sigma factor [Bacillus sp. M6-12]PLS17986.1 hypothetical protein CVD28_09890 [Bacillus sp. M6-12]
MDLVQDLIQQCQSGDKEAFGKLVNPYIKKAYATAFSILKSKESAEDAVQNSLLEAYKNIMAGKEIRMFPSWFFTLVTSRSLDIVRRTSKEKANCESSGTYEIADQAALPLETVLEKEDRLNLLEKILELPEKDRILIILYYYQELTIREIASQLVKKEGAVKTELCRARHKLQSKIKSNLITFQRLVN